MNQREMADLAMIRSFKYGVTSAEIPIEKKNEISHRGKALEAMKIKLRERL